MKDLDKNKLRKLYNLMVKANRLNRQTQLIEQKIIYVSEEVFEGDELFNKVNEHSDWVDTVVAYYSDAEFGYSFKEFKDKVKFILNEVSP